MKNYRRIDVPKLHDRPISDTYIWCLKLIRFPGMQCSAIPAEQTPQLRKVGQTMSEGKDAGRSRRKKRRGQLDREKETRRAEQSRTANLESKTKDEKAKLDLRIRKLIDQGYSPESVAKRVGVSVRQINSALDSNRRR